MMIHDMVPAGIKGKKIHSFGPFRMGHLLHHIQIMGLS